MQESTVTEEVTQELENETNALFSYFGDIDWQGLAVEIFIAAVKILLVALLIYISYRILKYFLNAFFKRKENADHTLPGRFKTIQNVSLNILKAITVFIALYTTLSLMGIPVGTLLAGAGVVGLAVSFGAQGFVSDLINGFRIIFEEQMHVGDTIVVNNIEGIVQNVGIQTTVVRDFDGVIHYIPNREIIMVSNKSRSNLRVLIELPLYPETDLTLVRDVMEKVNQDMLEKYGNKITQKADSVSFVPYTNGQIAAQVIMYTKPKDMFTIRNDAFESYVAELNRAGIDLPDYVISNKTAQ